MDHMLLRVDEVAAALGIGRSQAYALCASGVLPVVRIGRSVRVPADALRAWVRAQTQHGEGSGDAAA
ncbi:MAG: helix-turn-helix domain-containing protein [Pirellulales bacterium]